MDFGKGNKMKDENVKLMFAILQKISKDEYEAGVDKTYLELFKFLENKDYLILCYDYLKRNSDNDLVWEVKKFVSEDEIDNAILNGFVNIELSSRREIFMFIKGFLDIYNSSIIANEDKKYYAFDFVLNLYTFIKFGHKGRKVNMKKSDVFEGIGAFKEMINIFNKSFNFPLLSFVDNNTKVSECLKQLFDSFCLNREWFCSAEKVEQIRAFSELYQEVLKRSKSDKHSGYSLSAADSLILCEFAEMILDKNRKKIFFDKAFVKYPGRLKYFNDKLNECETNPYLREEIFDKISEINFYFFDYDGGNKEYHGEGDPFIKWMDMIFDSYSYSEMLGKIECVKDLSVSSLNYSKVNVCDSIDFKDSFRELFVEKKSCDLSQLKMPIPLDIVSRMNLCFKTFLGSEVPNLLSIHSKCKSVSEFEENIAERYGVKILVKTE